MLNQKVMRVVEVTEKVAKALGHKGVLTKKLLSRGVAPKLQKGEEGEPRQVRLRGYPLDISEGERCIKEVRRSEPRRASQ